MIFRFHYPLRWNYFRLPNGEKEETKSVRFSDETLAKGMRSKSSTVKLATKPNCNVNSNFQHRKKEHALKSGIKVSKMLMGFRFPHLSSPLSRKGNENTSIGSSFTVSVCSSVTCRVHTVLGIDVNDVDCCFNSPFQSDPSVRVSNQRVWCTEVITKSTKIKFEKRYLCSECRCRFLYRVLLLM